MENRGKSKKQVFDENLPGNMEYISKFYKKSENEIKKQKGEGKIGK